MRTKTLLIAAVLGAAGALSASAQVTSVNAVGYVNKELGAGRSLIANPLSNGGNSAGEVIPVAPIGATIEKWNAGTGSYDVSSFLGTWAPAIDLPVGEGFFLSLADPTTITFVGEVLQGDDTNKNVPAGFSMQGSLVPQAGSFTDLGFPATIGDTAYLWNAEAQGWDATSYLGLWAPTEPTLGVGDAVFVDKAEAGDWDRNFSVN